jgi:hypothetical protein
VGTSEDRRGCFVNADARERKAHLMAQTLNPWHRDFRQSEECTVFIDPHNRKESHPEADAAAAPAGVV